ncbi:HpcH/HpaI aldolase/citrate lyase family protein [Martelella mediterranea]|uniref:Citrate lyase subunit beta/citryl-CoA lyase n=1 Tax=Martelella mediterranea TaxID=293089 RepID=A0A4R3NZK9_9HYPH|nr:CoA ester lyase [Martelella mediterranea]TCT41089.1 citrate lyase subunit beta/citryl-CoA lyase [Martelella mediterranea]
MNQIQLARSVLCVPAVNRRALEKSATLPADVIIYDLEDAVARERKGEARENLERLFKNNRPAGKQTVIRINPLDTDFGREDMRVVLACQPDAVLLPKVETVANMAAASAILNSNGAPLRVKIWGMLETPRGVVNAAAIAGAYSAALAGGRLEALIVGVNDLRSQTGVLAETDRTYLVPWLMQVVLAARAYGLRVIDGVYNDFSDTDGFVAECEQSRAMGFDGKMLIHPSQIEGANRHFSPSDDALAEAHAIINAFSAPEATGLNVIDLNGRMVERLHLEQAEKLVALASAINQTGDAQ